MAAAELKTKRRHPKQSSGDAQRLSLCSRVLRCHGACRAGRRFSSREGEGNRPCIEQHGFLLGITGAADSAPCGGTPARVTALRAFIPRILALRSLLTAGSSPPFPSSGNFRRPRRAGFTPAPGSGDAGSVGRADPGRIPRARRSRLAVPLPTRGQLKSVSPVAADPLAATAGGAGTQRSPWPAGVAVTPRRRAWETRRRSF